MCVVTVSSVWALVTYVSEYIVRMSQEKAREASTPRAAPGSPSPREAHSVSSPVLVEVRAPGLTCTIRGPRDASGVALVTFRQALSPDIEDEYRALASQLPAREPPLRESYATEAEWSVTYGEHIRTWSAWTEAYPDDSIEAYHRACDRRRELAEAHQQPRKAFTVAVGLNGRAQRVSKKVMNGIRKAETWRFDPEQCSLLEELLADDKPLARLKAQGKCEKAAEREADTHRLVAQLKRQPAEVQQRQHDRWPWAMKPLWIEPGVTTQEDTQFALVLRLCQERMIESPPAVTRFLTRYLRRRYKYALTQDERRLWHQGCDLGGGEGFAALLRTDSDPESARGRHQYIAKTLHGRWRSAAREEAEQSGRWLRASPRSDGLYTAYDAARILSREADENQWTPSRYWVYDQINKGTLPDAQSNKCLDEHGLQCAKALVQDERARRALVEYQMQELGKSRRAANKLVKEHRDRGESYADMTNLLLRRGKEEP